MKLKTLTLFFISWLIPLSILQCEEWSLIIYVNDVQGISNDLVFLGMCETCHDEFHYGEDEYNTPPPPEDYVDIRATNFEWIGYTDENDVTCCQSPHFNSDKKSIHLPNELMKWNLSGKFEGIPSNVNIHLEWEINDIPEEYDIYMYVGEFGYNMRELTNINLPQNSMVIYYENGAWQTNMRILMGGCASTGTSTYFWDEDGDGWGGTTASEYCENLQPEGWVSNNLDMDDSISCASNNIDDCNICDGNNTAKDCLGDCCGGTPNDVVGCGASYDDCGVCSAGNTENVPNSDQDCNEDCFGNAYFDDCNICSDGETGHTPNVDQDCAGFCPEDAGFGFITDNCGDCLDSDFNQSCLNDIFGDGPENVFAHIHDEMVSLSWDDPSVSMSYYISHFAVYYQPQEGILNPIGSTNLNEFTANTPADTTQPWIYCISVLDEFDNESEPNCVEASNMCNFEWTYHHGPNLVSLPCIPEDNSVVSLMESIDAIYGIIGEGQSAVRFNGIWVGALQELDFQSGYWFLVDLNDIIATIDFNMVGFPPPENLLFEIPDEGNYLISYQGTDGMDLSEAIPDEVELLINDVIGEGAAAHQMSDFNWIGSLIYWELGAGYWIKVTDGFNFSWENGNSRSISNTNNISIPGEFQYLQSTQQAFYFIDNIRIDNVSPVKEDWVLSFYNGRITGARNWEEGMIDVPVMGYDGFPYSAGYCETGDIPEFKFFDQSTGNIHDLNNANTPAWESNGIFILAELLEQQLPEKFSFNVYPNPFNPAANLEIVVPNDSFVNLAVYNLAGQNIESLVDGFLQAGVYNITWDGSNHPSGIYFVKFTSENKSFMQKLMLIK